MCVGCILVFKYDGAWVFFNYIRWNKDGIWDVMIMLNFKILKIVWDISYETWVFFYFETIDNILMIKKHRVYNQNKTPASGYKTKKTKIKN